MRNPRRLPFLISLGMDWKLYRNLHLPLSKRETESLGNVEPSFGLHVWESTDARINGMQL